MECLLFTVCVMSGARLVSKQGMGKTERHPAMRCLFGQRGKLVFGDGILTKQFHLLQIRFQAAQQCKRSLLLWVFYAFWPCGQGLKRFVDNLSLARSVYLWTGLKVAVSISRGSIRGDDWVTTGNRASADWNAVRIWKKSWKQCTATGVNVSASLLPGKGRRDAAGQTWPPLSFTKALRLFLKQHCVTRAAEACFMSSRSRVQTGQLIACCYQWGEQRL